MLILGKSGTGKELVARAIHFKTHCAEKPMVPVNCGAIPERLLKSELFGHERGAFTGAARTRIDCFELANGGTIYLEPIPLGQLACRS
jgi:transcriptional regulator with GAF, ATPase, and Fis domain